MWDRARAPPYAERSESHHADFITISSEGQRAYRRRDGGKKILRIVLWFYKQVVGNYWQIEWNNTLWSSRELKGGNLIDFYPKPRSSYIINQPCGHCLVVSCTPGGNVASSYIRMNFKWHLVYQREGFVWLGSRKPISGHTWAELHHPIKWWNYRALGVGTVRVKSPQSLRVPPGQLPVEAHAL